MGRKNRNYKQWKITIAADLAGAVELRLWDHVANKPTYASRSSLVETLLREWVEATPLPPELPLPETINA